ncbi:MAG: methyltransferase domain-containing protein [Bryobacterales bacterium]|nr:methyltransferase domain-containing protein [Bryobacterales bacterium]
MRRRPAGQRPRARRRRRRRAVRTPLHAAPLHRHRPRHRRRRLELRRLDCVGNLEQLPFPDGQFDACVNIVTLEHVMDPPSVLKELGRVLKPGGELLLVAPHEWEEHQTPHDYWRFTRYGLRLLLERAGFAHVEVEPVGGFFRLLARRLAHSPRMLPAPLALLMLLAVVVPVFLLPLLDAFDHRRNFTLGFICRARKGTPAST